MQVTETLAGFDISEATKRFLNQDHGLLIGDEALDATDGGRIETVDPGSGAVLASVAGACEIDVDKAVTMARAAFDNHWRWSAPQHRERLLGRLADLIESNALELAELECLDTGKPLRNAKGEVALAASCFRYYAGWPTKTYGETNPTASSMFSYTVREPVGVCGQITAWNYPFLLASWKVAPALAFGNTVVLKPPEQTPLTSLRLGELCLEAGFPPGVVNVLPGYGNTAGQSLVDHPAVSKIAFTGSTATGKAIARSSATTMKRLTLELGGKSPNVVFADADLDAAAAGAIRAIFWNSGQVCVAGSRLFVERSILDDMTERVVAQAQTLTIGHGLDPATQLGPLISDEHRRRVSSYVEIGESEGASVLLRGDQPDRDGYYLTPTILGGVHNSMRVAQEEIFGPVLTVMAFDDMDEAVRSANDTPYGLAASVWTSDVSLAHRVASRIDAGTVWINTFGVLDPSVSFGGFKQSGLGRELGPHALDAYTEVKSVYVGLGT